MDAQLAPDAAARPAAGTPARPRPTDASNRWIILALAAAVVALSAMLSLRSESSQVVVPLLNVPLPPLCAMKNYSGLDCPGCGLTRSFIALGHGQWQEALRFNPAGPVWFALIAGQIPWQALQLQRLSRGRKPLDPGWWGQGLLFGGMAALVGQWVVRQMGWL